MSIHVVRKEGTRGEGGGGASERASDRNARQSGSETKRNKLSYSEQRQRVLFCRCDIKNSEQQTTTSSRSCFAADATNNDRLYQNSNTSAQFNSDSQHNTTTVTSDRSTSSRNVNHTHKYTHTTTSKNKIKSDTVKNQEKRKENKAKEKNKTYHGMIGTPAFNAILMIPFRFNIAPTSSLLVL